jgi:hypothetical protein
LIQMRHAAIARCHRDVLELNVHVVLGLEQLAAVDLPGGDFERDDMALLQIHVSITLLVIAVSWPASPYAQSQEMREVRVEGWLKESKCRYLGFVQQLNRNSNIARHVGVISRRSITRGEELECCVRMWCYVEFVGWVVDEVGAVEVASR